MTTTNGLWMAKAMHASHAFHANRGAQPAAKTEESPQCMQHENYGSSTSENTKCGSEFLQKVLDFSCAASVVDFKIPLLDVKFSFQENCNTKAPLEALLQNGELSAPANNNHISVDMNYCDVVDVPLIIEGESLPDHWTFCSHEIFAESLI